MEEARDNGGMQSEKEGSGVDEEESSRLAAVELSSNADRHSAGESDTPSHRSHSEPVQAVVGLLPDDARDSDAEQGAKGAREALERGMESGEAEPAASRTSEQEEKLEHEEVKEKFANPPHTLMEHQEASVNGPSKRVPCIMICEEVRSQTEPSAFPKVDSAATRVHNEKCDFSDGPSSDDAGSEGTESDPASLHEENTEPSSLLSERDMPEPTMTAEAVILQPTVTFEEVQHERHDEVTQEPEVVLKPNESIASAEERRIASVSVEKRAVWDQADPARPLRSLWRGRNARSRKWRCKMRKGTQKRVQRPSRVHRSCAEKQARLCRNAHELRCLALASPLVLSPV